ncbi:MAG: NTP transferase domain-containing protein [Selenomonadaceae bacterium]|nr:NTP transferase domain-containing protein [Selenomonadaceae bacterium]
MQATKSIIISCAGIGSRLGLGTTKALIDIHGKPLIRWQLEMLENIEDVRIVVGFEARKVIQEVKKYRPDAIFVFNHEYFTTKTGYSYYLGARDGNDFAIEYDGDLLVHPDDMKMLLQSNGEWLAYADKTSEDAVYVRTDKKGNVVAFSLRDGEFEWTGPCCMHKSRVKPLSDNVYNQLEAYLPMRGIKIRAYDIDTYADYERVLDIVKQW